MDEQTANALIEFLKKVINGDVLIKEVGNQACSGNIYVPKKYVGKKAVIFLIKDEDQGRDLKG